MPTAPNICLVLYQACVPSATPIYVYIGKSTYDSQYDLFAFDSYFVTINQTGFSGTYYTAGICPPDVSQVCDTCVFNPAGPLDFSLVNVIQQTNGATCYGNDCFILENCENTSEQLFASAALGPYLGSTVKIVGSDKCWHVIANGPCDGAVDYVVDSVCDTCVACLPLVESPIEKVEPQYFEDFTKIEDTQNEIVTNTKFANAYWDLYKSLKHGIESNCNTVDLDQITIKKKACDINQLYDAEACIITTPPVEIPCPEPTGTNVPQAVYVYKTLAHTLCCDEPTCIGNCVDLDGKSKNGLYFNFTVSAPIALNQLPMTVNYENCCLLIENITPGADETSSTFDFEGLINFSNNLCGSCYP
jgi:hypothetical protein